MCDVVQELGTLADTAMMTVYFADASPAFTVDVFRMIKVRGVVLLGRLGDALLGRLGIALPYSAVFEGVYPY